jgi:hypothetical protein
MFYTLDRAVKVTGLSKSTILKAIECRQITGTKNLFGEWEIEHSELHQACPSLADNAVKDGPPSSDAATLEAEIGALIKEAGHSLRGRLDDAHSDATQVAAPAVASECSVTLFKEQRAWNPDIRINDLERASESIASSDAQRIHTVLVTGALLGTLGIVAIVGLLFLGHKPVSIPVGQELLSSTHVLDSKNQSTVSNFDARWTATLQSSGKAVTQAASALRRDPTKRTAHRPDLMKTSSAAQQNTGSLGTAASGIGPRPKIFPRPVPFPETKPTTIEGWTVLDVVDGAAILEGPDGIKRAMRGDTVPGVGRVESIVRWGRHWVVATSRGLISTP